MCDEYYTDGNKLIKHRPFVAGPNSTTPGIGPGSWDSGALARTQERKAMDILSALDLAPTVYRIYTEDLPDTAAIVARHFDGATLYRVDGLWQGKLESGLVIEILDAYQYRDRIIRLAVDIVDTNAQSEAIVTWQSSHGFEQVRVFGQKEKA